MLDEITSEKVEKIAREIIDLSRNKLLVNLRFMDMALSQPKVESRADLTQSTSTDGGVYIYNPEHILSAYRAGETLPTRNLLHSIFHCVFRHMFISPSVDIRYWDLACDIAVECVINDLDLPYLNTVKARQQSAFIKQFAEELKLPSAEKVYRFLMDKNLANDKLLALIALFKADDHFLWYLSDEEKAAMGLVDNGSGSSPFPEGSDGELGIISRFELSDVWTDISERMSIDLISFSKRRGTEAGLLIQNLKEVNRERYNYEEFLKKFAVRGEVMKINPDEFDYNFYTYGLSLYGNLPLIEPLEYKDVKRIRDFVIVIDTSGSVAGELVQTFVQKTYNILKTTESFFTKINLHIIQCDAAIQEDVKITTQGEFDEYIKNMKLHGFGGTDFRPALSYVNMLVENGELKNLKGLIYFTDGYGVFPAKKPRFETAFVFIDEGYEPPEVPPWAIRLVLRKNEI
ncbi:MAG: metallopeptidase [Oscillospiraceae bacterium]|nr:metallopeptidase [Oscillospiraceae bacterium]